jgi:hypothetical protein
MAYNTSVYISAKMVGMLTLAAIIHTGCFQREVVLHPEFPIASLIMTVRGILETSRAGVAALASSAICHTLSFFTTQQSFGFGDA